jgi:pyridoxal phosphate enzyme (YggS family)
VRRSAEVAQRLSEIRRRIAAAGADPDQVRVVAVTKGRPVEDCRAALEAGLSVLGENRVQEALPKLDAVGEAEWHLIGHLQTNKVRLAAGRFALIQSVDSLRLAEALARRAPTQPVLVEVNVSREARKHGFPAEAAVAACREVAQLLDLRGLMGMAAAEGDPGPAFRELRRLHAEAEQALGRRLPVLSMGMTQDFEAAVRAGSNMIRIGRALFG